MVGEGILGHSALLLYQETESSPLFCERHLVSIADVVLQLALLVGDSFNELGGKQTQSKRD